MAVTILTSDDKKELENKILEIKEKVENSGQNLTLDTTLTQSGEAADAKATGDEIRRVEGKIPTKPEDIGALPNTYTPPNQTAEQVGADPKGTAESAVAEHNTATDAHNDIRVKLEELRQTLAHFFNATTPETMDQISELVSGIEANADLIAALTTGKVSVSSIVANLTTNLADRPLAASMGVELKKLIDQVAASLVNYQPKGNYALESAVPTKVSQLTNDRGYLTEHQDISGKLDADKLPQAVEDALAQAKASGDFDGEDGYTPVKGKDYKDGVDGVSPTVAVSAITGGHRISITDKSGTKTVDVMDGEDGDPGDPGRGIKSIARTSGNGAAGTVDTYTVTYTDGTTSTYQVLNGANGKDGMAATFEITGVTALAYGAAPTVTEASGSTAQARKYVVGVPQGEPGDPGAPGDDGYTPKIGKDYWTQADKDEIHNYIVTELAKRAQLRPEPAESLEWLRENGNHDLIYVLPNGNMCMWLLSEKQIESGPAYTNRLPLSTDTDRSTIYNGKGYKENTKLSGSGGGESTAGSGKEAMCSSGFIFPVKSGDILRIKGIYPVTASNHYIVGYDAANARTGNDAIVYADNSDGSLYWTTNLSSGKYTLENNDPNNPRGTTVVYTINTAKLGANVNTVRVCAGMDENTIVTINEEIKEGGGTTIVKEYDWVETGLNITPPDYEPRIIELEEQVKENTTDIADLKKGVASTTPIKTWDAPIYDANIPVFQLSAEKAAIPDAEKTVAGVYAKYDALMARHPQYITKTDLGMCSDGVTPVYRYDFREPEPHRGTTGKKEWSETKAKAIIVSGIHWEWGGIFALYNALEELADNPALFHLRRNTHLIVLPVCNPYAVANMSVRNANQVEIHRNFEVDFIYPGEPGYIEIGERSHGGTEPLSEIETQYMDNIMKANTDAAFFLTCHSNQSDTVYGTGFTWASPATYYMCNMHYRIVDKLSKVWMEKYGDELAAGIADYRTENTPEWDTRLGSAYLSTTNGTETKQATKYGIQATNIEVTDAFLAHGTKANPEPTLSSFTMSRGAEVYINFLLTAFGVYDPKDKNEYAPTTV